MSSKGMIVAPQPEAVEAGALVLKQGGNAVVWRFLMLVREEPIPLHPERVAFHPFAPPSFSMETIREL